MEPIIIVFCCLIFAVNVVGYLVDRENEEAIKDIRLAVEQAQSDIADLAGRIDRINVSNAIGSDTSAYVFTNRKRPSNLADDLEVTAIMSNGSKIEGRVDQLYWSNILAYRVVI